ncbi:putative metalloprotease CJM1_0395 family protein [Pelagibaculum spongiae]|uniref:Catalase n=1 Tax=Pelagibaculum spongiae TaxID=2080658 RepID=A0A2V1H2N8_9GAMM|nr:putative metalloprotease CJM1_0395 family protein [Pelagibaculum spongiae]PVZ72240.1 hypothetical protein DC094_04295 [Pelagibaculum spongiae]
MNIASIGSDNSALYSSCSANRQLQSQDKSVPAVTAEAVHQASEEESISKRPVDSTKQAEQQSALEKKTSKNSPQQQLSQQDLAVVDQLKRRDQEVKTHEQAHISASAGHASSPSFQYEKGPDGRLYAKNGEVSIDTGEISGDPQATVEKMQAVIQAANAPAQPSAQDRKVAAQASVMLNDAMGELADLQQMQQKSEQAELRIVMSDEPVSDQQAVRQVDENKNEHPASSNPQTELVASNPQAPEQKQNAEARLALERKFVDSGVFAKTFPQGSLVSSFL